MICYGNRELLEARYRIAFDFDANSSIAVSISGAISEKLCRLGGDQFVFVSGASHVWSRYSVAAKRQAARRIVVCPSIRRADYGGRLYEIFQGRVQEPVVAARVWDPQVDRDRELLVQGPTGRAGHERAFRIANIQAIIRCDAYVSEVSTNNVRFPVLPWGVFADALIAAVVEGKWDA